MTGSSQNRIVNSKSWQFSVGSHPTLLLNRWKDSYWLQFEGSFSPTPCPSQDPAAKLTPGTALMRKWPALRAVGGPPIPMHLWAPAKPTKSCHTLEGSRDLSGHQQSPTKALWCSTGKLGPIWAWQSLAKALGHSERQQGPLQDKAQFSRSPRVLWREAGSLVGMTRVIR